MDAVIVPSVVPIVVGPVAPVVPPIVVVARSVPEGAVVVVVVPVVVEVVIVDVDVGIAVVPIGAIVVVAPVAPIAVTPIVVAVAPVAVTPIVAISPIVVAVTVPIGSVPASTARAVAAIDDTGQRLSATGSVSTDARSVRFRLRPVQTWDIVRAVDAADIRAIASADVGPVSIDVRAVSAEARSGFGGGLLPAQAWDVGFRSGFGRSDATLWSIDSTQGGAASSGQRCWTGRWSVSRPEPAEVPWQWSCGGLDRAWKFDVRSRGWRLAT